jgi:hypothetical protein
MKEKNFLKIRPGKKAHDFGKVVAEQDPDLQDYYIEADKYVARAMDFNDSAVFFVGPKGAGKSAILQMVRLNRSADKARIINISPDDLAFSALANIHANTPILSEVDKNHWLFKSLWDYILSLEVLRREHKDRNAFIEFLTSLVQKAFGYQHDEEAKRLLKISIGDDGCQQSLSSRILQLVNEVELSVDVAGAAKVAGKAKVDGSKAGKGSQLGLLSLINSVAKKIAENVRSPYYILIDDLDLHWRDTKVQNAFIAALFLSLRNFSKPPNLKCVVAIRDQIFRRLPLADRDKYQDWLCQVEWDANNVREMVEKRITSTIDIGTKDIWGGLFPANAFSKMVRHSYGRPREAIRLLTICINEAQKKARLRVEEEDLDAGIGKFSDQRIAEVGSEFSYQFTGLEHVARKLSSWPKEFPLDKLKDVLDDIWLEIECGEEIASEYPWAGGYHEDIKGFARVLLECGILLYKPVRTSEPVLYDVDKRPEIGKDTWLAIHPAFWPTLGIAE